MSNTKKKIIDATMELVMENSYSGTTTKDIAKRAHINESTIFRNFQGKRDIILQATKDPEWFPIFTMKDFTNICGNLEMDLLMFSKIYMERVTPKYVKISIGLRTPELFTDTREKIIQIPHTFLRILTQYFKEMYTKNKITDKDFEELAITFFSLIFGFVFLKGTFGEDLTKITYDEYRKKSIRMFVTSITV